ncbi:hypothetical protein ACHWQZ_G012583 [Mnemiopsis leidyi]
MPNYRRKSTKMFKKSPSASNLKNRQVFHTRLSESTVTKKFKIGICAMENKSRSGPMKQILSRLDAQNFFEIIVFTNQMLFDLSIDEWPRVDCLLAFYSTGFPLDKAIDFANKYKPFMINDLEMQKVIRDREKVYSLLKSDNVPVPRYEVLKRKNDLNQSLEADSQVMEEHEDHLTINDHVFTKPFVEKPLNADDHNIYIYYPQAAGGGSQRLFRKVYERSSIYSPISRVRKFGSYIYEDFMPTDGQDVKVYTIGLHYAHAEARKSPTLDGRVERDKDGKELRYPVILSAKEKEIARLVALAFKQNICGFDLLRANGQVYVCDVNGFSFVKNSPKYYDDCAQVLGELVLSNLCPELVYVLKQRIHPTIPVTPEQVSHHSASNPRLELRCVLAIVRHGDRTPKQKMKMIAKEQRFIDLFNKYAKDGEKELKLKRPAQMKEVLEMTRELILEKENKGQSDNVEKLKVLKSVLEMYGHFSGVNRKVQLKWVTNKPPNKTPLKRIEQIIEEYEETPTEQPAQKLLLILKWGGELTMAGRAQSECMGDSFRSVYPNKNDYSALPGSGFIRLHSTYRHDLKIYASDEGRVQTTAAAFAKGLLSLDGEIAPILYHLVRSHKTDKLLDQPPTGPGKRIMANVKLRLHKMIHNQEEFTEEDYKRFAPTGTQSLIDSMRIIKSPYKKCCELLEFVKNIVQQIKAINDNPELVAEYNPLYHDESVQLMLGRWSKLEKDFQSKDGSFDISKIPDIFDNIKYDVQHNSKLGLKNTIHLYTCVKPLADLIVPQEYGITEPEKVEIGRMILSPLVRKLMADLKVASTDDTSDNPYRLNPSYMPNVLSPGRYVRTRLYFTSESLIHSFLNLTRYAGLCDPEDESWKEAMEYLGSVREAQYHTQIVLMMYEDRHLPEGDPNRFRVSINFSPGTAACQRKVNERLNAMSEILLENGEISSGAVTPAEPEDSENEAPLPVFPEGMEDVIPSVQEVESLDSMKFLTKAELVEQIVRPLEEGDLVDANWTALLRTQPCSPEDAAFREWLNSFPKERRFSPAALRYAAAIFTEGDGHEAVEPLVTLHNNIPLHQMEAFLQKIADANDVTDLMDCEQSDIYFFDPTPSPSTASRDTVTPEHMHDSERDTERESTPQPELHKPSPTHSPLPHSPLSYRG